MALQLNTNFIKEIEDIVWAKDVSYMDAILFWCESENVEIEQGAALAKKSIVLKAKLEEEAENLNFMKKTSRLPI